jgi:hypothetical protein
MLISRSVYNAKTVFPNCRRFMRIGGGDENPSIDRFTCSYHALCLCCYFERQSGSSALVDEIFNYPHSFGPIPPVMDTIVKERLTQAEMKYKLGLGPGAQESDIVHIANTLADKFQLPEYARTTLHQVEVLRFSYELSSPVFMGVPSPLQDSEAGRPEPPKLSPAQATFLLLTLVDVKLISPDYQLAPDEWEKTRYGPMMENLVKYKELKESGQQSKLQTRGALVTFTTPPGDIRTLVSHPISQMSLTDGLDLVDQAFAAVGIGK